MNGLEVFWIGGYEYRKDIMDRIDLCLDAACKKHCKVFVVSLLVRFPEEFIHDGRNSHISEFLRRIGMFHDYHKIDCWYVWAREQNESHHPHYHLFLVLNGSRVDIGWQVLWLANKIWADVLGVPSCVGCIELCERHENKRYKERGGIRLIWPASHLTGEELRKNRESYVKKYHDAREWGRYLAKTFTKGVRPAGVREWGSSRF